MTKYKRTTIVSRPSDVGVVPFSQPATQEAESRPGSTQSLQRTQSYDGPQDFRDALPRGGSVVDPERPRLYRDGRRPETPQSQPQLVPSVSKVPYHGLVLE